MQFLGRKKERWTFLFWSVAVGQVPAPAPHARCGKLPNAAKIVEEPNACETADLPPCKRSSRRVNLAEVSWGAAPEVKAPKS